MSTIDSLIERYTFLPRSSRDVNVPSGWILLVTEFVQRYSKLVPGNDSPSTISIISIRRVNGELDVRTSAATPAIRGLIRKFRKRAAVTCETCGKSALVVQLIEGKRSLCPDCAAPLLLRSAVSSLSLWSIDILDWSFGRLAPESLPWVLREDYRNWFARKTRGDKKHFPFPWEIAEWMSGIVKASRDRSMGSDA